MTTIYLVRHGEAEGNAFRRIHGQYDTLLTPTGFRQTEALARRFQEIPVDACFSSDLTRASLTARAVYLPKRLPLYRDPAFREIRLGRWEDLPFGYLERVEAEAIACFRRNPVAWQLEGAEGFHEYTSRFIRGMKAAAARFPEKTIAIFCHSAVLRGVLMELFFHRDPAQVPYCDNTAVSKLLWDGRAFTYEFLNDNSHLPEALQGSRQSSRRCCNLWYRSIDRQVPPGWPQPPEHAVSFLAMAQEEPVGLLSLDRQAGRICRLFLPDKFRGQYGEDQLLGQAVSCLRRWGHKTVTIRRQDAEPDELLDRYGFRPAGALLSCNLDPSVYSWDARPGTGCSGNTPEPSPAAGDAAAVRP
ncbi:MAG: histidine phosphatase family protein [Oscillospiraceae bacterium]